MTRLQVARDRRALARFNAMLPTFAEIEAMPADELAVTHAWILRLMAALYGRIVEQMQAEERAR